MDKSMLRNGRAPRRSRITRRDHAIRSALEPLEDRLLLSTYLVNGNEVYINGADSGSVAVNNPLVGSSGIDSFIIQNTTASFTINGNGGADSITVDTDTASNNTLTITDSSGITEDSITIVAPSAGQATTTLDVAAKTVSVLSGSTAVVNYATDNPTAVSFGGHITAGENLIVNATSGADTININNSNFTFGSPATTPSFGYSNSFSALIINGQGGNDTFNVNLPSLATELYDGNSTTPGGGTSVHFNVLTNNQPVTITGGTGDDFYAVTSNDGPLSIAGHTASNTLVVNGNSSTINFSGGTTNVFTINANGGGTITLDGDGTTNLLTLNANSGTVIVNGNAGTDTDNVVTNNGQLIFNGGTGTTHYNLSSPPGSSIIINGNAAGAGIFTFHGSGTGDAFTLGVDNNPADIMPPTYLDETVNSGGSAGTVYYKNLTQLILDDSASNAANSFLVQSDTIPTTINGGSGNDTFNIQSNTAASTLAINGNGGTNTVNLGSAVPSTAGDNLTGIVGNITYAGSGNDILNFYDTGDATGRAITLSATNVLSNITAAVIAYSGLTALNFNLDNHNNILNVTGTPALVTTTANLGTGTNTVNVGSVVPAPGGTLNNLAGPLDLVGSGADSLFLDDSGGTTARAMDLAQATSPNMALTTTGLGTISYSGFASLHANLGTAGNTFTITSTNTVTPSTITGGSGDDTYNIIDDSSAVNIFTGGGSDVVNVQADHAATTIDTTGTGSPVTTFNIGSLAPTETGGVTSGIQSLLTLTGSGADVVTVDDSGDAAAHVVGGLTATHVTGLGMGTSGIAYSNILSMTINLGSAGNLFTITNTGATGGTTINGGAAADTIALDTNTYPITINGAAGNDTITVDNTASAVSISGGAGADTVNVLGTGVGTTTTIDPGGNTGDVVYLSSVAGTSGNILGIHGAVNITDDAGATETIDDSADLAGTTGTLGASSLTFSAGGSPGTISFATPTVLNVDLGSGVDNLTVTDSTALTTNISSGAGNDVLHVEKTTNPLNLNTGTGTNDIDVGSAGTQGDQVLDDIQGQVSITGSGSDLLTLDDGGGSASQTVDLYSNKFINDGGSWAEIDFTGLSDLLVYLGSFAGDTLTVDNTPAGAITGITLNSILHGSTVTLDADSGPTTIHGSAASDTINILTTTAVTTIISNSTVGDTINVGSTAPTNTTSNLDSLTGGPLVLTGNGLDVVNLYDDASTIAKPNILFSGTAITGLAPVAIDYTAISAFNIQLGTASDAFTINSNSASTLNITTAADTAAPDIFNVQAIQGATTLIAGAGGDTVNVSSTAPTAGGNVAGIGALLTFNGATGSVLNIDNSGDSSAETDTITPASITTAGSTVDYSNVPIVDVDLSSGDDVLTIAGTEGLTPAASYNINTEAGTDEVEVENLSDNLSINTGTGVGGSDAIYIGSNGDAGGGVVSTILDPITIVGQGSDALVIDDSGDANPTTTALSATQVQTLLPTVTYSGLANLTFDLGSGGNTFNALSTAAGTSTAVNTGGGTNVTNVGSLAPAADGNLVGFLGALTVTGQGTDDTLNIDDSGATAPDTGSQTASLVTLAAAPINYTSVANLNIALSDLGTTFTVNDSNVGTDTNITGGPAADIFNVLGNTGPVTINTGLGNDTVNVSATGNMLLLNNAGGMDDFDFGPASNGHSLQNILGVATITGAGSDNLTLDDSGDTTGQSVALSPTTEIGASPANIVYSGLASLTVSLGSGNDVVAISNTITGTETVNAGDGNNSVTVAANQGPLYLTSGSGTNTFQLNSISALTYVTTGAGANTINLDATTAPVNIITGSGADVVNLSSTAPTLGGTLDNIAGAVDVIGGGLTTLNLDDTGSTAAKSMTLLSDSVSGLSPADIAYSGLSVLDIMLGSGVQTVAIHSTAAGTSSTVTAGSADDNFTLSGGPTTSLATGLAGPITVDGALGTNALTVDDSSDASAADVVLTPTTITGIGAAITYLNFASLAFNLASSSSLTVNGTPPGINLSVGGGGTVGYVTNLNFPGNFTGAVTLSNVSGGTIDITGDLAGSMSITGSLDALDVGGDLSGSFALSGNLGALNVNGDVSGQASVGGNLGGGTLGNLSGSVLVGGAIGALTITNDLTGTLTAGGDVASLDVAGDLAGLFTSGGTVGELAVGNDLSGRAAITDNLTSATLGSLFGALDVGGAIGSLTINGQDAGTITAGAVGIIALPYATVSGAGNNLFDLTQAGVYRAIRAVADNGANLSGLTANIFYEGSTDPTPQAAVRLTNSAPSQQFDLVLSSAGVSSFNLEGLDSTTGSRTGLFNLAVNGSMESSVDAATAGYFAGGTAMAPEINLKSDSLGLISFSQNIASNSIYADSIQGIAFSSMTMPNGQINLAPGFRAQTGLLFNVLGIDPTTKKPYAQVLAPGSNALRVIVSPASSTPVGVYTGRAKKGAKFASNAMYFTDQNSDLDGNLMADLSFSAGQRSHGEKVVSNINFEGDGGAVNTWSVVQNIHSEGWLGDVYLEGGYAKLQSITAPAVHGNINLFDGQLDGQVQTTGEEIDPITGATTSISGDLGSIASGSSTLEHVDMKKGSSIVVRGDLISRTTIDDALLGYIAVSGDIDGPINVLGNGASPGQIIALGNINGDIGIAGDMTGQIAVRGSITGTVFIGKNLARAGSVIADGSIAKVMVDAQQGLIAAGGSVGLTIKTGKSKSAATIVNADNNAGNESELANIWTNNGVALALDTAGTLDEAGLTLIKKDVQSLHASDGTLSGTTP